VNLPFGQNPLASTKYSLLSRVRQRNNIYLIVTGVFILLTLVVVGIVVAVQLIRKHNSDPTPNVAFFNLTAALTPPAGHTLKFVYLGYGTQFSRARSDT
jgi:hypothetical protein